MTQSGAFNHNIMSRITGSLWLTGTAISLVLACIMVAGLIWLDHSNPPPLDQAEDFSVEVVDRNNRHLKIFTNNAGRWRLKTQLDKIDPNFLKMLIAYEDKRFYDHHGVDPLALLRAAGQLIQSGKVVSGGSTISMQLARLMEPRKQRSITTKLWQIFRSVQIERRLSKQQILERYLTLAPYGGNIEGVRAASLAWFDKEPQKLALREAALLVALPQSPENRRPDRWPHRAKKARDRVLERLMATGIFSALEVRRVARLPISANRPSMRQLVPHLAQFATDRDPAALVHKSLLDANLQDCLEKLAHQSARKINSRASVAIVVADSQSGDILASVGSAGIEDESRKGWIDMTQTPRSPGSTLKPFVYGLAVEDGLVRPASMITDRPTDFGGYRPANFDLTFQGDISVRQALQRSLNVPAVKLMDAVGPTRLVARMKRAGVSARFPSNSYPGLGLVLGGTSLSLTELVQLYANLTQTRDRPISLGDGIRSIPGELNGRAILSPVAAWHVRDILFGIREPNGSKRLAIGYKTGTSYGHRDAWSIGFDGRHVIGVWVGRADNGPLPGITGMKTAAPILFESFAKSTLKLEPLPPAPAGALRESISELPAQLQYFQEKAFRARFSNIQQAESLVIAFPSHGDELEQSEFADGSDAPVIIKLQGGVPPFRLLENKRLIDTVFRQRHLSWTPKSKGTSSLLVMDSLGQTQALDIIIR